MTAPTIESVWVTPCYGNEGSLESYMGSLKSAGFRPSSWPVGSGIRYEDYSPLDRRVLKRADLHAQELLAQTATEFVGPDVDALVLLNAKTYSDTRNYVDPFSLLVLGAALRANLPSFVSHDFPRSDAGGGLRQLGSVVPLLGVRALRGEMNLNLVNRRQG